MPAVIQHKPVTSTPTLNAPSHVTGKSLYVDALPVLSGTLYAAVFGSPLAHGRIKKLDLAKARQRPGVVRFFTKEDIPGEIRSAASCPTNCCWRTPAEQLCLFRPN